MIFLDFGLSINANLTFEGDRDFRARDAKIFLSLCIIWLFTPTRNFEQSFFFDFVALQTLDHNVLNQF